VKVRGGASAGVLVAASLICVAVTVSSCSAERIVPPPPRQSAAQRDADTRAELALRWSLVTDGAPTFLKPDPAIVRYTTYFDLYETIAGCLRKTGFPATKATTKGIFDSTLNPGEQVPFELAAYNCEARYPEEPVQAGYLTADQSRYLYGYWQQQTVPCLRARGAIVRDLAVMPAIGTTTAPKTALIALNPYEKLKRPSDLSLVSLEAACPAFPAALASDK
jgi:hypothetical protein